MEKRGRLLLVLLLFFISEAFGANRSSGVIDQYPIPGALHVPLESNIGIHARAAFDPSQLGEEVFLVIGSRSGQHTVLLTVSDDRRTLICHPLTPFALDEEVRVMMSTRLLGGESVSDSFSFHTVHYSSRDGFTPPVLALLRQHSIQHKLQEQVEDEDTLPQVIVTNDSGTPGTIYLANGGFPRLNDSCYLLNLNEHGSIVKDRKLSGSYGLDFKRQPNGMLTYFDYGALKFYGLDTNWNIVDSFAVSDGYLPDDHELMILPNGHYALIAISRDQIDMRHYVTGGDSAAIVQGNVIEIFDRSKNNIFQWRGIDHYDPGDAIHEFLVGEVIDFEHANSLDFDSVGNLILSNRHLCEITKINSETGDIIWRFGGAHNQFALLNDSVWFSYQHSVKLMPNGHLLFMDNSNYDSVIGVPGYFQKSRAVEYELDTAAKTATLVWQYHHSPEIFTDAMGSVERLPNGNTFIGWGEYPIAITEVRPDTSTAFEMILGLGDYSYRAYKYVGTHSDSLQDVVQINTPQPNSFHIEVNTLQNRVNASFSLVEPQALTVIVTDVLGREIFMMTASESTGDHSVALPSTLATGCYFCTFRPERGNPTTLPFTISQ